MVYTGNTSDDLLTNYGQWPPCPDKCWYDTIFAKMLIAQQIRSYFWGLPRAQKGPQTQNYRHLAPIGKYWLCPKWKEEKIWRCAKGNLCNASESCVCIPQRPSVSV